MRAQWQDKRIVIKNWEYKLLRPRKIVVMVTDNLSVICKRSPGREQDAARGFALLSCQGSGFADPACQIRARTRLRP